MQSDSVSLTFPRSTWSPGTRVSAVHSLSEDGQLIGGASSVSLSASCLMGSTGRSCCSSFKRAWNFRGGGVVCRHRAYAPEPGSLCRREASVPVPVKLMLFCHLGCTELPVTCATPLGSIRHCSCFALLALRQDQGPRKPGKDPPSCGHRGKIPERKGSRWEGQALGRERGPGAGEGRLHGGTLWGILAWAAPGRAGSPSPFWFFPRKHPRAGHQAPAAAWCGDRLGFFSPPGIRSNPNFLPPDEKQHSPCADAPHAFSPSSFPTRADSEPFPSRRF